MDKTDLSLVPSDELKAELQKRYDVGVILMNRSRSEELAELDFRYWGDIFAGLGMMRAAQQRFEIDAAKMFDHECGDEED